MEFDDIKPIGQAIEEAAHACKILTVEHNYRYKLTERSYGD